MRTQTGIIVCLSFQVLQNQKTNTTESGDYKTPLNSTSNATRTAGKPMLTANTVGKSTTATTCTKIWKITLERAPKQDQDTDQLNQKKEAKAQVEDKKMDMVTLKEH